MICRKCGAELPENTIRCSNCGIKVNMYCPECQTLNSFGTEVCKNCGFKLLIHCSVCGSINAYSASKCRKCNSPFDFENDKKIENKSSLSTEPHVVEAFSSDTPSFVIKDVFEDDNINSPIENKESLQIPEVSEINTYLPEKDSEQLFKAEDKNDNKDISESDAISAVDESQDILDETIEDKKSSCLEELFEDNDEDMQEIEDYEDEIEEQNIEENNNEALPDSDEPEAKENLNFEIQPEVVLKTVNLIENSLDKNIIAINGEEGCGKSAVLSQVNNYLLQNNYICLYGSCTPLVQITSFGFFQDAFLRLMGFPPFVKNFDSFKKDFAKSSFFKMFSFLDKSELDLFLNIFYPSQKDKFENILENKKQMFCILEKVIKSFLVNNNVVISIDNFELLDGASYDFIVYLLKKGFFNNRLKLLAAYQENKSIQSYFDLNLQEEKSFETILIQKFSKNDLINAVSKSISININEILNSDYLEELTLKSDGNAIRMEQEIAFLFDIGYIIADNNEITIKEENLLKTPSPVSFEDLIKLRLNALNPIQRNILYIAAVMGYRFSTGILSLSVDMPVPKSENIIDYLVQELFIKRVDKYTCEFKSLSLWKLIYKEAKSDLLYKENAQRLYNSLKPLVLSSNLQKLISCSDALSANESFIIWQNTASLSAGLGDTNLYVIAQKQCLKILDKQDIADSEEIKKQIYEEIGKLLYEKSPKEAITYLSNVLDAEIRNSNVRKILDVCAYFIKSCYLTGNYFGVTEIIDEVVKSLKSSRVNVSELDIALIQTRKLNALLNIGNCEQIINLVNEDIIPEIERELNSRKLETSYKNIIVNAYINSRIILAKAYAIQGNNVVSDILSELRQYIETNNLISNKTYYLTSINIIEAFSKTMTGYIKKSNEILQKTADLYKNKPMETNLLAQWNLISIINRVMSAGNDNLKIDLFELAAFTNNINEHFIKNIIKLILGYVLKQEGNTLKALEIFNEEITYFAKEKIAIGAMLSWALIVQISLDTGDIEKALNTAVKSLEIAQSPKINNYFFIIYFQKFLAEVYLRKGDLTAAKMYLEKSIMIAKQFDLKYQLIELYISYGEYLEELMKVEKNYSSEYIRLTSDMYNKASELAKELSLENMMENATRTQNDFKTFCRLNSLEV